MYILGLTGSIGMGKTTAAAAFRTLGVPVFEADKSVHRLMDAGGAAVAAIEARFPGAVVDGAVDRARLAGWVFDDRSALDRLERILHPLVRVVQYQFLRSAARRQAPLSVLDVPLLYETGGDNNCDSVAVVSAPPYLQAVRVLGRPGMSAERFQAILARQLPDREKRRRAEFVIQTGMNRRHAWREIKRIVQVTAARRGRHWPHQNRYTGRGGPEN